MDEIEEYLTANPALISKRTSVVLKKMNPPVLNNIRSHVIQELSESNETYERLLKHLETERHCLENVEQYKSLERLVQEMEHLDSQLKTEKAHIKDLKCEIRKADLEKLRLAKEGVKGKTDAPILSDFSREKNKESSQLQLQAVSGQLSHEQTKNAELRENIKTLMSDRKRFNKEFDDLLEKLQDGKKYMQELNTNVQQLLLKRSNLQTKLNVIHEKEEKQKKLQQDEMYDLEMRLENESTLKRFNEIKNQPRLPIRTSDKIYMKKAKNSAEILADYSEMCAAIMQLCGLEDAELKDCLDDVLQQIIVREAQNMSLFNFCSKQYDELQALREKVIEQERRFEDQCSAQEEKRALHQAQTDYLESRRTDMEERTLSSLDEMRGVQILIDRLFTDIDNLVNITNADVSTLKLLLGDNDKSTKFNYSLFLQAVETKIIRLLKNSNIEPRIHTYALKPKSLERTKTVESRVKSVLEVETKINITKECLQCFPIQKESSTILN